MNEVNDRNVCLENKLNDNDKKQRKQLEYTLKSLQEKEKMYDGTMASLKKENQSLKAEMEDRDLKVNELEEMLNNKNKELECCSLTVNSLEKELKRQSKERKDMDEKLVKLQIESNEQISKLKQQLQQNTNDKDTEIRKNEISMIEKSVYLESELKQRDRNVRHLEDILSSKDEEIIEMRKRNKFLESTVKDSNYQLQEQKGLEEQLKKIRSETNNKVECLLKEVKLKEEQLSEQTDQLKHALKQLHEKEADLANTIASQNKLNKDQNDKISQLEYQQQQTLEKLDDKESEVKQMHQSFVKKIEHLQSELDRRDQNFRHLEGLLNKENDEMSKVKERNEFLERKEKQNDAHIRERSDELNRLLKKLQETEAELGGALMSTKKQSQGLEKNIEIRNMTIKKLENELKYQNDKISELEYQQQQTLEKLDDKESEVKQMHHSFLKKIEHLQSERDRRDQNVRHLEELLNKGNDEMSEVKERNEFLERKEKGNDAHIGEQSDELNRLLKKLQETEAELGAALMSKKKQSQSLEKNIEIRNMTIKKLENELNCMKIEMNGERECFEKKLREKDEQLSEEKAQFQEDLKKTNSKFGENILSLKNQNKRLKSTLESSNLKLSSLEKLLNRKNAEINEKGKQIANVAKENDTQISELRNQLQKMQHTSNDREAKMRNTERTHNEKIKYFESEVERREQDIGDLNKVLNKTKLELNQLSDRNKFLQKNTSEKETQVLRELSDQVKCLQEKETESERIMASLKKENQCLVKDAESYVVRVTDLEEMLHDRKIENISNSQQGKDVYEKEQMITELRNQLQQTLTTLRDTETELDEVKTRLSKPMGDRLTDNNPNITHLSDKNRPTKLAERFAELYDNQWTDAYDILDKFFKTEENIIEVLLLILLDAMTFCKTKGHEQMKELGCVMEFSSKQDRVYQTAGVRKLLKDYRKVMTSDSVAVENLYKMYMSHITQLTDEPLKRAARKVVSFSKECLEICWFMVIQDPAVVFAPLVKKGSSFNTDLYKPYTSSGTHVDFVVWPPLLLHEAGPILAKGVAQGYGVKSKTSK